jgi:hypothetical protein
MEIVLKSRYRKNFIDLQLIHFPTSLRAYSALLRDGDTPKKENEVKTTPDNSGS